MTGARYVVRLDSPEQIARAGEAVGRTAGASRCRPLKALSLETDAGGRAASLRGEPRPAAGETSTPKKVLETLLAIPPEAQAALAVTREVTLAT